MTKAQHNVIKTLVSQACQARDGHKCVRCRRQTTLCASHIYPKGRYKSMMYDLDNVKTLCYSCHMQWWHKNPIEAGEWIDMALPKERLNRLKLLSQLNNKASWDYNALKLYLESEIKKYGN